MNVPVYMSSVLLNRAHKLVRMRVYEVLEKYELNPTYWSIMAATNQSPEGVRLSSVAEMLEVKAPMVTTEAVGLIERGLIRRIPHHSDKRAKLLVITPKGKKLTKLVEDELNIEIDRLLKGLTPDEIVIFQKALEVVIHNSKN